MKAKGTQNKYGKNTLQKSIGGTTMKRVTYTDAQELILMTRSFNPCVPGRRVCITTDINEGETYRFESAPMTMAYI